MQCKNFVSINYYAGYSPLVFNSPSNYLSLSYSLGIFALIGVILLYRAPFGRKSKEDV